MVLDAPGWRTGGSQGNPGRHYIRIHTPGLNLSGPPLTAAAAVGRSRLEAVGWELTSGRPWVQNDTKTGHLEHLNNLGPVMVQNDIKTDRLEHLGCPGPKSSKMSPKLLTWSIYLEGLGPIVQNNTKTNNLEPLNNTLRGFAARQASKRHLPKALGLPGVSKRHLPKGLSLTRGWAVPSLF